MTDKITQRELFPRLQPCLLRFVLGLAAGSLLLAGCRTQLPLKTAGPDTAFNTRYQFGTPLTGPQAADNKLTAAPDFMVRAQFLKLNQWPPVHLSSLAGQSTITINNAASRPTMAFPALSAGAQFANVNNSATWTALLHSAGVQATACGQGSAAVWPGVAVAMRLTDAHGLKVQGKDLRQLLALWVWQPKPAAAKAAPVVGMAFEIKRFQTASTPPALARQIQVLPERHFPAPVTYGAILPFHFLSGKSPALAVLITIRPWTNSLRDRAIANQSRQLIAASQNVHHPVPLLHRSDLTVALHHLGKPGITRASLVYLAGQAGAGLTQDVAVVAPPSVLRSLAGAVAANTLHARFMTLAQLGWTLDKTTYLWLYQIQKAKPLAPQLGVALELHLGEAAWHVSSLNEIARHLGSRRDYRLRIIKENLIYLEDSSPAARLTAFNWLNIRHLAPAGYNPLAGNRARNSALNNAENNAAYLRRIQQ